MLSKYHRLRGTSDIKNVFANGKSTRCGFLFLKHFSNSLNTTRVMLSVGLSYSKSAVERNAIRRKFQTISSKHIKDIKKGYDCVFFLEEVSAGDVNSIEILEKHILRCLKKAGLLKNKL